MATRSLTFRLAKDGMLLIMYSSNCVGHFSEGGGGTALGRPPLSFVLTVGERMGRAKACVLVEKHDRLLLLLHSNIKRSSCR